MNCTTCGGSIGEAPAVGQRHYSPLDCVDVMRIERNSLKLQNGELVALVKKIDTFFESPKIIPMQDTLILDIPYEIAAGVKAVVTDSSLKRKCACRPMTYQEGLDGNCVKCGLPMEKQEERKNGAAGARYEPGLPLESGAPVAKKRVEPSPKDPNRCFCAGTEHCRWCGKEPCVCDAQKWPDPKGCELCYYRIEGHHHAKAT